MSYVSNISLSWICYWLGAGDIPATTETVLDRVVELLLFPDVK